MRSDVSYIIVTCDRCLDSIQIYLTVTAHGYDERDVDDALERAGWSCDSEEDLCSRCLEEQENEE